MGANIRNFPKFYRAVFQKSNNYARQNEYFEQFWPKYIYIFYFLNKQNLVIFKKAFLKFCAYKESFMAQACRDAKFLKNRNI